MTVTSGSDVYYDPYDVGIDADPYPTFRRLREEAPLYRNEAHDFFAVSRFDDVQRGLNDKDTYISSRGGILELIRANIEMPPGVLIFEDPPVHTVHRGLLSRVFTPRRMAALEIGMLLGIPEEDQETIRDNSDKALRTEAGKPMRYSQERFATGEAFADYIDWRADHPSDDLMTQLLQAEFEDETGTTRRLTRQEILTYVNVVAGAGNETTGRLIGWTGKTLADHPDQRRMLVEDPSLIPDAIEELLRFEPPAPHVARYVNKPVELYGETIEPGNVMMRVAGAPTRHHRRFPDGDTFDIRREQLPHITFGYGIHYCLGAALARLEGRIALDEVLKRFPEWEIDLDGARLAPTSTVRGWETLPVSTGT
jgi:cytochrome P450